jgi:hypothetical protein
MKGLKLKFRVQIWANVFSSLLILSFVFTYDIGFVFVFLLFPFGLALFLVWKILISL